MIYYIYGKEAVIMPEVGVINEIGDMGLGFDLLNKKDQKTYNESVNKEKEQKGSETSDEK